MEWNIPNKERISEKLAIEIFSSILNGVIPAGSKLPTIKTLLKRTNTSVETLRKALRILIDWKIISKTRLKLREDTILINFPLYCPKCKQETLINVTQMNMSIIKEPDAQTKS